MSAVATCLPSAERLGMLALTQESMEGMLALEVFRHPDGLRVYTPDDSEEWELETASQLSQPTVRLFVALYPYNPAAMSPNPDTAGEELPFVPGQIIKVKYTCRARKFC